MNLETIPNIAPQLRKEILYPSQRDIVRQLKNMANKICRETISPEYINRSFNKFKQGYVYYDETGYTMGFCLWTIKKIQSKTENERHVMHVHLICGKKMPLYIGNKIFPDIDAYCLENNVDAIQLEPANEYLKKYYESYGFELTDTYLNIMTKRIQYILSSSNRSKTRKQPRTNHTL